MKKLRFIGTDSGGALFVHTVETGNRLRLPPNFGDFVPWINEDTRKAYMFLGRYGGVQILRESISGGREIKQIISDLRSSPPKTEASGTEFMRLMRYELISCEVEFSEDRFGIVLPREFRDMGVLPNDGEAGAILILGEIIEIWRADKLLEHAQDVRGKLLEITNRALEELEKE